MMETRNDETSFFSARLTPYRSLGPVGFAVLMGFVGVVSFVTGVFFALKGAWPVFGFFGLDVAAIYVAFRINFRSARAFEEVQVGHHHVLLRKVSPGGEVQEYAFNPRWVRLEVERHDEAGTLSLTLASGGSRVELGGFLNPPDRDSFAAALSHALATAKADLPPATA